MRIFRDFASGKSPRAIAKALNDEGLPGPGGREWRDTTIRGQPERGTGILNNALYVGRLEWNRCSYVKDPRTGKRVARPNPQELWETAEVPQLRIVPDELWARTRERFETVRFKMRSDEEGNPLNRAHRSRSLLSGLLKCAECGGNYTTTAPGRYGCATRRAKGTCSNTRTIRRGEIEARVLEGLKHRLMAPELVREFIAAFQQEVNRSAAQQQEERAALQLRRHSVDRKIAALVSAIEDGRYSQALADRLAALETERDSLPPEPESEDPPVLRLHPRLGDVYADKVANLAEALSDPDIRDEANEIIRSLIDRVELRPGPDGEGLQAVLHSDIARIVAFCGAAEDKQKRPEARASGRMLSVVAGTGFEPVTFRL